MVLFFLGLLLSVFFTLFIWHNSVYNYQQSLVRITEQGRNTMGAMQANISQAYRVLDSVTVNGTNYTSSTSTLALQLPAVDSGGNVVTAKWDYVIFIQSGLELTEIIQPDPVSSRQNLNKQLSDSLQTFAFTYNNNDFNLATEVSVSLNAQIDYKGHVISDSLQQNFYLKNYY